MKRETILSVAPIAARANLFASLLLFLLTLGRGLAQDNWPQFRGGDATGVATNQNLPVKWSAQDNVAWSAPVPGWGWSSPIIWGDQVVVTSVLKDGEVETPKKGLYFGGERPNVPKETHQWMVYAFDWQSGKKLWEREVVQGTPGSSLHLKNTYASETPVTDGKRIYAYFGNQGLYALDLEGKVLWSQKWGAFKTRNGWGTAASPVLHRDRIFVVNDNEEKSFLVALDTQNGRELWKAERDEKSNWSTPFVWEHDQRVELIVTGKKKVRSYDLNGKVLWELGGMSSIVIPTPFAHGGLLYVCSGYVGDNNRPVYAIRPGATGDISLKEGESHNSYVAWCEKTAAPYNPSPLAYGDYFYVLFDFGFLSCREARTGKEIYAKQRINPDGNVAFTASPWAYGGRIFCLSEDGDTYVFQAGPEYKLLGKNSLGEMCMATPAIARDSLILRTASKLYRVKNSAPKS